MSTSDNHPVTDKPNTRYMSITLELNDDVVIEPGGESVAWRDVLDNLQLYGHPHFAPNCQVVGMSVGDAMSELDILREED